MLYVRGNPLDYDTWSQFGNRGWSYDSVLPYFKKSEHFEPGGDDSAAAAARSTSPHMREHAEIAATPLSTPPRPRASHATPTTTTATRKASATTR